MAGLIRRMKDPEIARQIARQIADTSDAMETEMNSTGEKNVKRIKELSENLGLLREERNRRAEQSAERESAEGESAAEQSAERESTEGESTEEIDRYYDEGSTNVDNVMEEIKNPELKSETESYQRNLDLQNQLIDRRNSLRKWQKAQEDAKQNQQSEFGQQSFADSKLALIILASSF